MSGGCTYTYMSVNRLPFELISRILVLATGPLDQRPMIDLGEKKADIAYHNGKPISAATAAAIASLSLPKRFIPSQVGLSHVCRYWRVVTLATGELWTMISFEEAHPFSMS